MKKIISGLLILTLALGLFACGSQPAKEPAVTLSVGYAKANITPEKASFMAGYGDDLTRRSEGVMDELFVTCVAITDSAGNSAMLITADLLDAAPHVNLRGAVAKATGIPFDQIIFCATHTHSAPRPSDTNPKFVNQLKEGVVTAATEAMADRAPVQTQTGNAHVAGLTYVRHYINQDGSIMGNNFGDHTQPILGHTTEADDLLQVIRFQREDKKDVVLVNWQGHPLIASTGSDEARANRLLLSSDYVGPCRDHVEAESDSLVAFFLSGSGNSNSYSYIDGEGVTDHRVYGKTLGAEVVKVLENMTTVNTAAVTTAKVQPTLTTAKGKEGTLDMYAVATGDISFVSAPYEMFDTTAMAIKDGSPYQMTFIITLANGDTGYMPTQECWDYPDCYEVKSCNFQRGTAETLQEEYLKMLNNLHR